jgi:peroxiredoxin
MTDDGILSAGQPAPSFSLPISPTETVSLADLHGAPAVLVFYPADFSPVCGDEVTLFEAVRPVIEDEGARLLGLSVDGVWCHQAFANDRGAKFPLLADFEPKGAVARSFRAYDAVDGTAQRALFVLDDAGTVAWSYLSPPDINPGADGVIAALEALRSARS